MDVVYHHRTNGRGGESVHIMGLVRGLEAGGHTVEIVSPPGVDPRQTGGAAPVDKGARDVHGLARLWRWASVRAPQVVFELMELGYNLYAARSVGRALDRKPGAVYYERYAFFLFAGVLAAKRRGRVVMLEVNEVVGIERARRQLLQPVMRRIERAVFARADLIFCVSSFLAREADRRGARPGTVHVVPNAVDRALLEQRGTGRAVRARYKIPDDAVVAGFVGWFDHWDRLDLLVEAVGRVAVRHPAVRLLLIGDGPMAEALRAQVSGLGLGAVVIMTGAVPRAVVASYVDAIDIGVLPASNQFGSPIALFEMMGLGKAVIAPDLAPIRDVVVADDTGIIVPPGDRDAMTAALERLLAHPEQRRAIGERARDRVREHHTWPVVAARVAGLADRVNRKGPR